jgi:hypothetical protein
MRRLFLVAALLATIGATAARSQTVTSFEIVRQFATFEPSADPSIFFGLYSTRLLTSRPSISSADKRMTFSTRRQTQ